MTFVLGAIYELLDAFITFKMHPEINGKTIFYVRLFIATLSVCILIGGETFHCLLLTFALPFSGRYSAVPFVTT